MRRIAMALWLALMAGLPASAYAIDHDNLDEGRPLRLEDAYPIASFTWLLIPQDWKDKGKQKVIVDFLNWMLDQGQTLSAQLNYAPLPDAVKQKEHEAIKSIH